MFAFQNFYFFQTSSKSRYKNFASNFCFNIISNRQQVLFLNRMSPGVQIWHNNCLSFIIQLTHHTTMFWILPFVNNMAQNHYQNSLIRKLNIDKTKGYSHMYFCQGSSWAKCSCTDVFLSRQHILGRALSWHTILFL